MTRRPLVGYYVHHEGTGHLHRALVLIGELRRRDVRVVVLSSLDPPGDVGRLGISWLRLARDDDGKPVAAAPGGLLHWAPRHHPGLRDRAASISRWLAADQPDLVVSDVSQEVTVLCRLHGVPVVSVVLPGRRGDSPHLLGLGVSERLVGFWPTSASSMVSGIPPELLSRLIPLGGLSRYEPASSSASSSSRRVAVLSGTGGDAWSEQEVAALRHHAPTWHVDVLGPDHWVSDPWPVLRAAAVVVTRAGQASIAEVAAARTPAVVVPAARPHEEQAHTAAQLAVGRWPAMVRADLPGTEADGVLSAAAALDGNRWEDWCDGGAAGRFADVVGHILAGRDVSLAAT